MKNKKVLIAVIIGVFVAVLGIGVTIYLLGQQQNTQSHAQFAQQVSTVTPTQSSCQPPGAVTNVTIDYPSCQGTQCDFNSASCSWDAISGAVTYQYKVTDVGSGTVIKNDSVAAPTTQLVFPITQGDTYKCDVNAVNSCGASGGTGSDSLLCKTDAFVSPTAGPSPTPGAQITPTPTTQILVLACGQTPCDATHQCEVGLTCVQASNGQSYCAQAIYQAACQQSPSLNSCCYAPTGAPTIAPTITPIPTHLTPGNETGTITIAGGSLLLLLIGGALFFL